MNQEEDQFIDLAHEAGGLIAQRQDLRGCLPNGPRGDQLVDLLLEAVRLLEGHDDLAVVGHVVVGEGTSLAVLEPLGQIVAAKDLRPDDAWKPAGGQGFRSKQR